MARFGILTVKVRGLWYVTDYHGIPIRTAYTLTHAKRIIRQITQQSNRN